MEGRERKKNETNKQNSNNSLHLLVGLSQAGQEDVWWWLLGSWQPLRELSHRSSRFQPATERFTTEPFPEPPLITGPRLWKVPPILWFSGGTPVHSRWNTSLLPGQPFHYSSQIHGSPPFTFKLEDNHTADCSVNLAWEGLQLGCWPRLSCDGDRNESMALRGHSGWV